MHIPHVKYETLLTIYVFIQLHNLESILGDLRGSSSDYYPDQTGAGGANDTGNKGCLDDSLQGKPNKEQSLHKAIATCSADGTTLNSM